MHRNGTCCDSVGYGGLRSSKRRRLRSSKRRRLRGGGLGLRSSKRRRLRGGAALRRLPQGFRCAADGGKACFQLQPQPLASPPAPSMATLWDLAGRDRACVSAAAVPHFQNALTVR